MCLELLLFSGKERHVQKDDSFTHREGDGKVTQKGNSHKELTESPVKSEGKDTES